MMSNSRELTNLSPQEKRVLLAQLIKKQASRSIHPLSHGQQALWFLYQLAPESAAYNIMYAAALQKDVDAQVLRQAFEILTQHHAVLRTTYKTRDGKPIQQVHEHQPVHFEVIDASNWNQERLNHWLAVEGDRPFHLEQGPVLRASLLTAFESDRPMLVLVAHHIAVDLWSLEILINDLRWLYQSLKVGAPASLAPLKWQYHDYVRWEAEQLASSQGERLWNYWQQKLVGELPVLNLPTDRPRPPVQTYNGSAYSFELNEALTTNLRALAKTAGTTPYMTLLAAFQVLLLRYTAQEDILVGSPMIGRNRGELEKIVGYFVNPVVLRTDLSGNPSFLELLGRVRRVVLEALEHQDFPFPLLVERLQPERDPSRSPLFQVAFVWDKARQSERPVTDSDALIVESLTSEQRGADFDLTLTMFDTGAGLKGSLTYNTDLFEESTIARMVGHYQTLLEGVALNPEQRLAELPLLTESERHQLLVEWNDTQTNYPQEKCIHQLFEAQAARTPDAVAVVFEEPLTYRELNERANQLAHYLQNRGVGSEVLVGICVERSLEMFVGLLGILKAGGAYVPLDPAYPQERLAYMLADAQVSVLVTQEKLVGELPAHAQVVCLDRWEEIAKERRDNCRSQVKPDNLAYVIYTSGSTGRPKGVLIQHQSLVNHSSAIAEDYQLKAGDRVLQFAAFSFDVMAEEVFPAWLKGSTVVVLPDQTFISLTDFCQFIDKERLTVLNLPVAYWQEWVLNLSKLPVPNTVRLVVTGSDKVLPERLALWQQQVNADVSWRNAYGPTEATITATVYQPTPNQRLQTSSVPIGRPIANTQVYLLDPNLQPVPIGVPGELYIGGAGLARGYLHRQDLTAEKFIAHPFLERLYKTGDLARYLSDGNIEFLGRKDDQVKIRGFRIELGEIEAVLVALPEVREVIVVAQDQPGNKRLVAYVVPNEQLTASQLRTALKARLPDYMVPAAFVFLEALPLTPSGKVNRRALPQPDTEPRSVQNLTAPRNDIERQLVEIWENVLNLRPIGVQDNFFDLGGHSLLAVQMMAQIEQQLGKNLPLAALFQGATVAELAHLLRSDDQLWNPLQGINSQQWTPLVPLRQGSKRPFFYVPGATGNPLDFRQLVQHLDPEQPFYGFQALGLDGKTEPLIEIEAIAARHIKAMQSIQPQGPYLLGGYSIGSSIAFEMALQLQQQGQQVAMLAIFDSSPAKEPIGLEWDDVRWLVEIAHAFANLFGKTITLAAEALQNLPWQEQLKVFKEQLVTVNLLHPETELDYVQGFVQVFKASFQSRYEPQDIYRGKITLFRASEAVPLNAARTDLAEISEKLSRIRQDSTLGWGTVSSESVNVYTVSGNHDTLKETPHVQVLAERLSACLDQVQVGEGG